MHPTSLTCCATFSVRIKYDGAAPKKQIKSLQGFFRETRFFLGILIKVLYQDYVYLWNINTVQNSGEEFSFWHQITEWETFFESHVMYVSPRGPSCYWELYLFQKWISLSYSIWISKLIQNWTLRFFNLFHLKINLSFISFQFFISKLFRRHFYFISYFKNLIWAWGPSVPTPNLCMDFYECG